MSSTTRAGVPACRRPNQCDETARHLLAAPCRRQPGPHLPGSYQRDGRAPNVVAPAGTPRAQWAL